MSKLPTPEHNYVRGDGTRIEYIAASTMSCPACDPDGVHGERRHLAVTMFLDNTVCMECPFCGHSHRMMVADYKARWKKDA
jgi:hypothetical protein